MKIALFTPTNFYSSDVTEIPSGIAVYTRGLAEALTKKGHQVTVIGIYEGMPIGAHNHYFYFDEIEVFLLTATHNNFYLSSMLHEFLLGNPHDVIEAHQFRAPLLVEQLIGGTPTVVRYASDFMDSISYGRSDFNSGPQSSLPESDFFPVLKKSLAWSEHLSERLTISHADAVLCAGVKMVQRAAQISQRAYELPLGISKVHKDTLFYEDERVLVSVSRMSDPRKGAEFIPRLLRGIPQHIMVNVIGECGPRDDALVAEIKDAHPNVVIYGSPVSDSELDTLYSECSCVIVPTKSESFGYVLLEPMAYGKPVICFDQDDPSKRNWPLIRLGDWRKSETFSAVSKAFTHATEYYSHQENRESLYSFAETFLWDRLVDKYVQVYTEAISQSILKGRIRGL
jgi:glycosyltransferase involved in cell wall biosynthesis